MWPVTPSTDCEARVLLRLQWLRFSTRRTLSNPCATVSAPLRTSYAPVAASRFTVTGVEHGGATTDVKRGVAVAGVKNRGTSAHRRAGVRVCNRLPTNAQRARWQRHER